MPGMVALVLNPLFGDATTMKRILIAASAAALLSTPAVAGDCGGGKAAPLAAAPAKDIVDTAVAAGQFGTLVKAVQAAGLVDVLKGPGPFTVFAPNDAAFAKVPAETLSGLLGDKAALTRVLTYHVVPGRYTAAEVSRAPWLKTVQGQSLFVTSGEGEVRVDGAKVVAADIATSNGIVHVIDTVVLPRKDLVDTAVAAGSYGTLVTAVKAAGLVDALRGDGPFTVFAPSDAAFAALPAGALDGLLKDPARLKAVLTYHVIPGRVLSSDLRTGTVEVKTLEGRTLQVTKAADGTVTVNGARVAAADVLAGNGVIHGIDAVVLPK
jgi:uncharacterized surface protein with fasciclin (FAS1) repeats